MKYLVNYAVILISAFIYGCNENEPEIQTDKYSDKFSNAENKDLLMPLAEGNYWIYKSLYPEYDTLVIEKKISAKNYTLIPLGHVENLFQTNLTIYKSSKNEYSGFFSCDSGIYECLGITAENGYYSLKNINESDTVASWKKSAPTVPLKNMTSEYKRNNSGTNGIYVKEIIAFHPKISIYGDNIVNVWEFKTITSEDSTFQHSFIVENYFKQGVGLLLFSDTEILNGFEILRDKKYLIDYKLN